MPESLIPSCAILAGGRSTRMGIDKATIILGGLTLLERTARLAQKVSPKTLIVGRTIPPYWPPDLDITFLPDQPSSTSGPIVGICTALTHTRHTTLILACDMPLLTESTLHQLLQSHIDAGQPAATLATTLDSTQTRRAEPLLATYTPAILPILQAQLAANQLSLQQLLTHPDVHPWHVPQPLQPELLNVNDPGALALAQCYFNGES